MRHITIMLAGMLAASAAANDNVYVKQVTFPADADSITKIEMASRLVPSAKQLAWQQHELTAFLHFGVNTFTDREWGDGKEDPAIFNPVGLDAEQWVKTLKDAGFKLVILTAKHHDGFCLWPTATTEHSVANSPWLDGKGDVVRMLRDACDKYDMKMGVYLSPWDRNAPCYGDSPAYNDMFVAQLTELLTNYGKIDEVWFDGACGEGPNGKKQVYDWTRFKTVIEELQPDAVVAIMGDDVRWVGNEKGLGRETEWSATAITPGIYEHSSEANKKLGLFAKSPDLGGRQIVAKADRLYWWPSEVDVSIRPGWFFHDKEQPKSLYDLADIYLKSVGRNSTLLLNIPPNREGLINQNDVDRLMELKKWLDDNINGKALTIDGPTAVNCVLLQEDISKGQQIEEFDVLGRVGGQWVTLASGTTVGHKRFITFPAAKVEDIKIDVKSARGKVNLKTLEAYLITMPEQRDARMEGVTMLPTDAWRAIGTESYLRQGPNSAIALAYDGDAATYWESAPGEMELVLNLGALSKISGMTYAPATTDDVSGTVYKYRLYSSRDRLNWTEIPTTREFSNIENNPLPQHVFFKAPVEAMYIKLVADETVGGKDHIKVGELSLFSK